MAEDKGCRLENSDFDASVSEQARSFAIMCNLDPDLVWPDFRDYWIAKTGAGATKKSWLATWQRWCRRTEGDPKFSIKRAPSQRGQPSGYEIPWENLQRDNGTGRPYALVNGQRFGIQEAWRLKRLRQMPHADLNDTEKEALKLWRM